MNQTPEQINTAHGDGLHFCGCADARRLAAENAELKRPPDQDCWMEMLAAAYKTTMPTLTIYRLTSTYNALEKENAELRKDRERLDWIIAEIAKGVWSPSFIAWMTETCHDRASIDAAIGYSDSLLCANTVNAIDAAIAGTKEQK